MRAAAADLEFEEAARLRDEIKRLEALDLGLEPPPRASASCGRSGDRTPEPMGPGGGGYDPSKRRGPERWDAAPGAMKTGIPGTIPRAALITGGTRQLDYRARARYRPGSRSRCNATRATRRKCPPGSSRCPPICPTKARRPRLLARATAAIGPIGVLINAASVRAAR